MKDYPEYAGFDGVALADNLSTRHVWDKPKSKSRLEAETEMMIVDDDRWSRFGKMVVEVEMSTHDDGDDGARVVLAECFLGCWPSSRSLLVIGTGAPIESTFQAPRRAVGSVCTAVENPIILQEMLPEQNKGGGRHKR